MAKAGSITMDRDEALPRELVLDTRWSISGALRAIKKRWIGGRHAESERGLVLAPIALFTRVGVR